METGLIRRGDERVLGHIRHAMPGWRMAGRGEREAIPLKCPWQDKQSCKQCASNVCIDASRQPADECVNAIASTARAVDCTSVQRGHGWAWIFDSRTRRRRNARGIGRRPGLATREIPSRLQIQPEWRVKRPWALGTR